METISRIRTSDTLRMKGHVTDLQQLRCILKDRSLVVVVFIIFAVIVDCLLFILLLLLLFVCLFVVFGLSFVSCFLGGFWGGVVWFFGLYFS